MLGRRRLTEEKSKKVSAYRKSLQKPAVSRRSDQEETFFENQECSRSSGLPEIFLWNITGPHALISCDLAFILLKTRGVANLLFDFSRSALYLESIQVYNST